jgi:hypothetical protein
MQKWSNSSMQLPVKEQYFVRKSFKIHVVVQSCFGFGNISLGKSDATCEMNSPTPSACAARPGSIRMMYWASVRMTGTETSKMKLTLGIASHRKERETATCSQTAHAQAP